MNPVEFQIETLKELLNSEFDAVKGKIPEDLIEAFIEKIVVHEGYYEWRFKRNIGIVQCTVDGNIKNAYFSQILIVKSMQIIMILDYLFHVKRVILLV